MEKSRRTSVPEERGGPHPQKLKKEKKRHLFISDITNVFGKSTITIETEVRINW